MEWLSRISIAISLGSRHSSYCVNEDVAAILAVQFITLGLVGKGRMEFRRIDYIISKKRRREPILPICTLRVYNLTSFSFPSNCYFFNPTKMFVGVQNRMNC